MIYEMMSMMAAVYAVFFMLVPFFFVYFFGAWQRRSGLVDPHLGTKVALAMLITICLEVMLAGTAALLLSVVMDAGGDAALETSALVAGALFAGLGPYILYKRASKHAGYDVTRRALGINAIVTGIVSTVVIIVFFQMLFRGRNVKAVLSIAVVYVPASVLFMLALIKRADAERAATAA